MAPGNIKQISAKNQKAIYLIEKAGYFWLRGQDFKLGSGCDGSIVVPMLTE